MNFYAQEDIVDDVALDAAGSVVSGLFEDDKDWNLIDILLSRNADEGVSLRVDFTAIQTK